MYKVRSVFFITIALVIIACGGAAQTAVIPSHKDSTSTPQKSASPATQPPTNATQISNTSVPRPTLAVDEWKNLPIVPTVSDTVLEIYRH